MKRRRKISDEDKSFIIQNYPQKGAQYCADALGGEWTKIKVFKFCFNNGIKTDRGFEGENFDIETFKNPSSPEMCYFLGYCWADGHVDSKLTRLELTIQKEDAEDIYEKIKNLGHFTFRANKIKENRKPTMSLLIHNTKICRYLETVGFREKSKESPTKLLETIPYKLHRYFWLGFFDGDGCLHVNANIQRLSFSGSFLQDWSSLTEFLEDLKCKWKIDRIEREDGSKVSVVNVFSKFDTVYLFELLYKDYEQNGIGLKRKRGKYLQIKTLAEARKPGKAGFVGIAEALGRKKNFLGYKVAIEFDGKKISGGRLFKYKEEAAICYDLLAVKYHGHRTFTNFPITDYIELGKSISGKYD